MYVHLVPGGSGMFRVLAGGCRWFRTGNVGVFVPKTSLKPPGTCRNDAEPTQPAEMIRHIRIVCKDYIFLGTNFALVVLR